MRAEDLRQIDPSHLDGINLRSTFEFPIVLYAHRYSPKRDGAGGASPAC